MLIPGRIAITTAEAENLEKLLAESGTAEATSITRAEPEEQGALLVQMGERVWLVGEDKTKEVLHG